MSEFFYVFEIIFIVFIIVLVKNNKNRSANGKTVQNYKQTGTAETLKMLKQVRSAADTVIPAADTSRNSATTLKDNKYNDWLAKQLQDEKRALAVVSDMFQLKQSHRNNCDAEFIKRFHESNCEAGVVDDGEKRR